MSLKNLPFNIYLMPNDRGQVAALLPVQSLDIYTTGGGFHPQGLYSDVIFGTLGSDIRQNKLSYIDIRTEIMHPKVFLELSKLKGLYKGIMSGSMHAIWDPEVKDFIKSNILDGKTGYSFFMSHFNEIVFSTNESTIRDLRIQLLDKSADKCMYRYIIVIPAGLRDIEMTEENRVVEDEINPLYRKLIRAANTLSVYTGKFNDPIHDTSRWTLQNAFNEIYTHIESILTGKKGFLLSKWGARNIHGGTRNVITAMDPAPKVLGSEEAITINDSACGLHQYLKGTGALSIYNVKTGPMMNIIENLPNDIVVIDKKTLKAKTISPSSFIKEKWGTDSGIEDLINGYEKLDARHKPILIDGEYAALIYRDDHYFKVFYDIDELPRDKSRSNVHPITWTEMFYISTYLTSKKVAAYVTRYPILTMGSIYPSFIVLKTTTRSQSLQRLDSMWKPVENENKAINMPITGEPFFESLQVHTSHYNGLGADNDGDKHICYSYSIYVLFYLYCLLYVTNITGIIQCLK